MPENKGSLPPEVHDLEWLDGTIPRSLKFGDTYFSQAGGLAETGHVFIGWNALPTRWPGMRECLIAELGFGTGLNFLETVRQWQAYRAPGASLHYIAFEAYPMAAGDLAHALSRWPELATQSRRLLEIWDTGSDILDAAFAEGVRLTLHFADANMAIPGLRFEADAWYLDGFAPSRNPQMWGAELMAEVFSHTKPGGTFATYTSAGWVKRNLIAAGFNVEKLPGFAGKREMLRGWKP
jgi:tRNA U34 5-methylaminomethyl-2-thiouridine-forming methyltransferase MnmC